MLKMGRGKQHFVSLLFTDKRTELVKTGMHILCLSLRISSFFLRIPPQKAHGRAFSTSPASRANFGHLVKVAAWFSTQSLVQEQCHSESAPEKKDK